MTSLKKILVSQGYIQHNIRLAPKSGHIVTKAMINGHMGRFIIDTGASATCVNQELYKEFQLETEFMERQIGTASGSLRPRISHKNTLELGDWTDEDVTLLSMDMSYINNALKAEGMNSIQGLLGADFLITAKAVIDYKGKKMYLKK
ncbi:retropepsin-like aspartic protease family protein [Nonlabens xiamenensis]|uniref:retropepsin-like aspartic protease family protein n=1 Tax=Nonlabens xiamenensis TaxID=2341043 RepID=UPI000F606CD8|nr:retropepsin-like aspartic protease [Nonlabens xiamenensis]